MATETGIERAPGIDAIILTLRGVKVILDADLALIYGVPTKRLNEQIKRNKDRFPPDFVFELTPEEKSEVVANCDHLARIRFSPVLPYAFTEHGAIMAANVPNSLQAVQRDKYISNETSGRVAEWLPRRAAKTAQVVPCSESLPRSGRREKQQYIGQLALLKVYHCLNFGKGG